MTPTRYGTSSAECPNGIYVLFSEYERVVAECADWKRRWQDAVDHASEAITERNHWQANHDHQVSRARFLIERGDIPVERVRAYEEMEALRAENDSLMSALAECREAASSEADNPYLGGAVGDPMDVPAYVKWELDRLYVIEKEQS